ncbi:MAG: hypothetical protein DRJ52_05510 [Thermoprotei archaeon]|nr:MAG: hypothetical protein DRJ52_05510 [Thermoprotei archaeon]
MKKALFITLGFDEKFAIRALMRHKLEEGDTLVVLTAKPIIDRVEKALSSIKGFITSYSKGVRVKIVEVPVREVVEAVALVKETLEKYSGHQIILNVSGGMRALVVEMCIGAALSSVGFKLELETEDSSAYLEFPTELLRVHRILYSMTDTKKSILQTILEKNSPVTVRELAEELGRDPSTLRRHLYKLIELGFVRVVKRKPLTVEASSLLKTFF